MSWTTKTASASSSPPVAPNSPRNKPDYPSTARTGASKVCAARKWRCSPGSASSTTPDSSAVTPTVSPTTCSKASLAPYISTKPNAPICSTSSVLPQLPMRHDVNRHKNEFAPVSNRSSTPSPPRPTCVTNVSTSSPPTVSAKPSTRLCSTSPRDRSTWRGSCSSARTPPSTSLTGTPSRTTPSPSCAPPPDATRTTSDSPTSSASSRHVATSSASAGQPTTSSSTEPAPNASTTPSSATSPSTSKHSSLPPIPANASTSTPPNPAHRRTTRSTCSPHGSPPQATPP